MGKKLTDIIKKGIIIIGAISALSFLAGCAENQKGDSSTKPAHTFKRYQFEGQRNPNLPSPIELYNSNIKELISEAKRNQTFTFGEDHYDDVDDAFFISIMPKLRAIGYSELGLEIENSLQENVDKYLRGNIDRESLVRSIRSVHRNYESKMDIIDAAIENQMNIHCFDTYSNSQDYLYGETRDRKQFTKLKERIFDKKPNSKVAIFCGAYHANEKPTRSRRMVNLPYQETLGYYLNNYTKGKNVSACFLDKYEINYEVFDYMLENMDFYLNKSGKDLLVFKKKE